MRKGNCLPDPNTSHTDSTNVDAERQVTSTTFFMHGQRQGDLPTRPCSTYGWEESTEGCLCYITQPDEVRIKSVNLETKLLITVILQHLLPTIFVSMASVEGNHTEVLTKSTVTKYRKHNNT